MYSHFRGRGGRGPPGQGQGRGRGRSPTPISQSLQDKFNESMRKLSQGASSSSSAEPSTKKTMKDVLVDTDKPDFIMKTNIHDSIIVLDHEDEKWMKDPSYLGNKYFEEDFGAPMRAGKSRVYYEQILLETGSIAVRHKKANSIEDKEHLYSQVHILRVIKCADWGLDPNRVRDLKNHYYRAQYNYWDYIDAWNNAFLYQNSSKRHSWFFYWDVDFKKTDWEMPNWFYMWWKRFGLSFKNMPIPLHTLADDYAKYHPKFQGSQTIEGQALLWFSVDYLVPWIWAWTYACLPNDLGLDCLIRNYHCKWWDKFPLEEKIPMIKQDILLLEKQSILEKSEQARSDAFLKAAMSEPINPITALRDQLIKENPGLSPKELKNKLFQEVFAVLPDDPMEEDKNDKGKGIADDSEDVKSLSGLSNSEKATIAWWEKQKGQNLFIEYDSQQ